MKRTRVRPNGGVLRWVGVTAAFTILASLASLASLAGCRTVATPHPQPETKVEFGQPAAVVSSSPGDVSTESRSTDPIPLPHLSPTDATVARPYAPPIDVDFDGTDIQVAIDSLAIHCRMSVNVDPMVHGPVTLHLHNVTCQDAFNQLVTSRGFAYKADGPVLRVVPIQNETQTFALNYVAMTRTSSGNTTVQRDFQGTSSGGTTLNPGGTGGLSTQSTLGSSGSGGGDVIQGYSDADVWSEVKVQLANQVSSWPARNGASAVLGAVPATTTPTGVPAASAPALGGAAASNTGTQPFAQAYANGYSLSVLPVSGLITVTGPPELLAAVGQWLKLFQSSVLRQVKIEAKIVEVDLTRSTQLGIDWSAVSTRANGILTSANNPTAATAGTNCQGALCFLLSGGNVSINAVLDALRTQGKVDILMDPNVSAMNNQKATFNVSTNVNFFATSQVPIVGVNGATTFSSQVNIQQIAVGTVLDVTAQIAADNTMMMNIRPTVTSLDRTDTFNGGGGANATAPVTSRRDVDTMVHLRNGETIIIGGLTQTQNDLEKSGIPGLMDLPIIGKYFTHYSNTQTRSELVIFITPTIVSSQPPSGH